MAGAKGMITRAKIPEQYIAFDDGTLEFGWDYEIVEIVKSIYGMGWNLLRMSKWVERPPVEVFILLLDLIESDKLKPRGSGVF